MSSPQEGWYPDPADTSMLRWWDGVAWTHQVRPRPATTPAASTDTADTDTPDRVSTDTADTDNDGAETESTVDSGSPAEDPPTTELPAAAASVAAMTASQVPDDEFSDLFDTGEHAAVDTGDDLFDSTALPASATATTPAGAGAVAADVSPVLEPGSTVPRDTTLGVDQELPTPPPLRTGAHGADHEDDDDSRRGIFWLVGLAALAAVAAIVAFVVLGGEDDTSTAADDGSSNATQQTDDGGSDAGTDGGGTNTTSDGTDTGTDDNPGGADTDTDTDGSDANDSQDDAGLGDPNPLDPSTTALASRVVTIESAGCGNIEVASAATIADGIGVTSQQAVTFSELAAITNAFGTEEVTYVGVTATGVALLTTDVAGSPVPTADPVDGATAGVVFRTPGTTEVSFATGVITSIEENTFVLDAALLNSARGGLVFDADDNVLGVIRRLEAGEAIVVRSGASLTETAVPEGPGCNDAERNPAPPTLAEVQALQDSTVRSFALIQLYLSSLANEDWATARTLDSVAAQWNDQRLDQAFGQWRRTIPIPLNMIDPLTWEVGLVIQEERDGGQVTILQCATFRVNPDDSTVTNITEAPIATEPVADAWVDTGAQRDRAADFCPG